jgi:hypothetical protein
LKTKPPAHILEWGLEQRVFDLDDLVLEYIKIGHLEQLQWCIEKGTDVVLDADLCAEAVNSGHFHILKWLRSQGCPWDWRACAYAASHNNLNMLKWLRSQGCPWDWRTRVYGMPHRQVSEWCQKNGAP